MQQAAHHLIGRDPHELKGASLSKGLVRRVWTFARPYRPRVAAFLGVIVASALLAVGPPLLIRRIVDQAIPNKDLDLITVLGLGMVGIAFGLAGLSLLERWLSSTIGEGLIYDLRAALFDHVQRMPLAFFTRTQTGALISRLNNDVIGAQRAITQTLGSVVSNVVVLVTTLIAMALLEWRLTLLSLVLLPLFIIPAKRIGRRLQELTREGMNLNASMNATMTERFGVSGALLVKLFGRHDDETVEFADRARRVRDIGIRSAMYGRTFLTALSLVGAVGTAVIYLIGARLVVSGTIELGTLIALGIFVSQIYSPLTSLTNARVDLMTAFVSFERVFEVLDIPNAIPDKPGAYDLGGEPIGEPTNQAQWRVAAQPHGSAASRATYPRKSLVAPKGRIDFDDVHFRYPAASDVSIASLESISGRPLSDEAGVEVLHGVTASLEPGHLVALVGPSGGGKTTLSMLVPRIYDVTGGAVRIDGHDVRDLTQASLRAAIGVVSQDSHLFHETVGENLLYAKPDATIDELEQACRAAQIHDVIAALPEGYDTVVGERGYRLSGGEKQRLAIARMLLKDPAVVILDEATSQLDSENESLIQQALAHALSNRTSIVIAHRLSTIVAADQILVMDEGNIVQRGRHDELLALGGLYADLYRTLVRAEPAPVPAP